MKNHFLACVAAFAVGTIPCAAVANKERSCTAETVTGKYGVQSSGFSDFVPGPNPSPIGDFVPIASVGLYEFLLNGTVSSIETANIGGLVFPFTGSGSFTVNPDCTGTLTRTISIGGSAEVMQFVIVQDGEKILLMGTFPGGRLFWGQLERLSNKKRH